MFWNISEKLLKSRAWPAGQEHQLSAASLSLTVGVCSRVRRRGGERRWRLGGFRETCWFPFSRCAFKDLFSRRPWYWDVTRLMLNKSQASLGVIRWHGERRCFCFPLMHIHFGLLFNNEQLHYRETLHDFVWNNTARLCWHNSEPNTKAR